MATKKRRYRRRGPLNMKIKKQTVYAVGAVWLWLIGGIILVSFFGEGTMLTPLRDDLGNHFGWIMYAIPLFCVLLSLLFFKLKSNIAKPQVSMGYGLLFFSLMGLTQSGLVGEIIWKQLSGAISSEGGVLVLLTMFVTGLLLMFNAALDKFMASFLAFIQHMFGSMGGVFSGLGRKGDGPLIPNMNAPLKIKGMEPVPEPELRISGKPQPAAAPPAMHASASIPAPAKPAAKTAVPAGESKTELKINAPVGSAAESAAVWEYPPLSLLSDGPGSKADRGDMHKNANIIEDTLGSFGITTKVVEVNPGPAVTQYAIKPSLGTKVSKITSLSSDLALALAAPTGQVRIEAPIPGRDLVGIEIPNRGLEFVTLKRMLASDPMQKAKSKLSVALGLDVSGNPLIADIGKMPHVLIAGTTGSGKSVLVNAFISSLLYRTTPQEVRLILVDPKRVELTGYNGIPHLLTPVIVEPDKILSALHWAVKEMESRYKRFAEVGVRNIDGFNEMSGFQAMPYIVIFIDELADLMAYAPADVEDNICRIAQMARAVGIHLVLATQRPSVDVITGLIKANVPSRIAFNVSSMIDSRVIIDMPGAEKLLGRGDMLYIPPDQSKPARIQGTYVSEREVQKLVEFLTHRNIPVQYTEEVISTPVSVGGKKGGSAGGGGGDGKDPLFEDAIRLVCQHDRASASLLQRRLSVGYARAARILDQLEDAGVIGPGEGAKPRDVLVKDPDQYLASQAGQAS